MNARLWRIRIVSSLEMVFLATLITICTGCIHPTGPIREAYSVEN
jgi:hypothetical protein